MEKVIKTSLKELIEIDDTLGLNKDSIEDLRSSTQYCDMTAKIVAYMYINDIFDYDEFSQMVIFNYDYPKGHITSYSFFQTANAKTDYEIIKYIVNDTKVVPIFSSPVGNFNLYTKKIDNNGILLCALENDYLNNCMGEPELKRLIFSILDYVNYLDPDTTYMDYNNIEMMKVIASEFYEYKIKDLIDTNSIANTINNIDKAINLHKNS